MSLQHDVEAGVLKKIILSDGAVVTVKGAKSISLQHPLDPSSALTPPTKRVVPQHWFC